MRRAASIAAWSAAAIVGVVILAFAIIVIGGNTTAGRRLIETEATKLSGGMVALQGLDGRFPDRFRIAHLELHDDGGAAWASIDGLSLDWSPLRLLIGKVAIERLAADAMTLDHLPAQKASTTKSSGGLPPLRIDLDTLAVEKLTFGPDIAGQSATLRLAGSLHLRSAQQGEFAIDAEQIDGAGRYAMSGAIASDRPAHERRFGARAADGEVQRHGRQGRTERRFGGPSTSRADRRSLRGRALRAASGGDAR